MAKEWSSYNIGATVALSFVLLVLVSVASTGAIPAVRIEPSSQEVTSGDHFTIIVAVENVTDMGGNQATVNFDPQAMSAVTVTEGNFLKGAGTTIGAGMELIDNSNGSVTFFYALTTYGATVSGSGALATIEFASDPSREGRFEITLSNVLLSTGTGSPVQPIALNNGSITFANSPGPGPFFDTGSGTYSSVPGIHTGTITPSSTLTVSKIYTYPCAGTGGHSEYVKIWNSMTGWNVTATWNGYTGDWHNISFKETFTLYANETYNYTIKTGSYPQSIHAPSWNATGGVITCSEFMDINGKWHEGWIPAIRLS